MTPPTTKSKRNTDFLRARCDEVLKRRVARLAAHRHCDESDILREAVVRQMEVEEERLGLPPIETQAA